MAEASDQATSVCSHCDRVIPFSNIDLHYAHCSRNLVKCKICGDMVPGKLIEEHFLGTHATISCSLCNETIERENFAEHKGQYCPQRIVKCDYCDFQLPAVNLFEHQEVCGSRTKLCILCRRYVRLREIVNHESRCNGVPNIPDQATSVCSHCDRVIPFSNIDLHYAHCSRDLVKCKICGDMVPGKLIEEHFLGTHATISCSLCNETIERENFAEHKGQYCPQRIVKCDYCDFQLPAVNLFEHQEVCGSRTKLCILCRRYVRLREIVNHESRCNGVPNIPDQATSVCSHCDRVIPFSNIDLHYAHCSRDLVKCKICGDMVPGKLIEEHFLGTHATISCSLCNETIERENFAEHKGQYCPQRIVKCDYCDFPLPAVNLFEHQEVCGSRTKLCILCRRYVRLREIVNHESRCNGVPNIPDQATSVCSHCDRVIPFSNIDLHYAHCSRNLVKCKICGDMVPGKLIEEHFSGTHATISCSLCNETIEREKFAEHKGQYCPQRIVKCDYCDFPLPAVNLFEHQEVCGSRTKLCILCRRYVRLREIVNHESRCNGVPNIPDQATSVCSHCDRVIPFSNFDLHYAHCSRRRQPTEFLPKRLIYSIAIAVLLGSVFFGRKGYSSSPSYK